jgi:hypothetical protein
MGVICLHCKVRGPGRPRSGVAGGKSKVVETRRVKAKTRVRGRVEVTRTIMRIRQCLTCRWRWRTVETTIVPRRHAEKEKI